MLKYFKLKSKYDESTNTPPTQQESELLVDEDKLTAPTRFSPRKPKTTQVDKPNTHQEKPKTTQENLKTTQEKQPNPLQPPQDKTNPSRPPSTPTSSSSATLSDLPVLEPTLATNKTKTQKKLPYQIKKRRTNPETVRDEALITDLTVPEAVVQPPAAVPLRTSPRGLAKLPARRRQQPTPTEVQQVTEVNDEHPIPDEDNTQPPAPAIDQFLTTQHSSDIDEEDEGPDLSSYPSIRCGSAGFIEASHRDVSGHKRKVRGVVNGSKVMLDMQTHCKGQRIKVEFKPDGSSPMLVEVDSLLVHEIGSGLRDKVPMTSGSWRMVPSDNQRILFDHLAQNFVLEKEDDPLWDYVCGKAAERFRDWKSRCKDLFKMQGPDVIPREFVDQGDEWQWLKSHFSDEKNKKRGEKMSAVRNDPNRLNHHSGKRPFRARAAALAAQGDKAPLVNTFKQVYQEDPKGTEFAEKMDAMVQQALAQQFGEESEQSRVDQNQEPLPEATQIEIISKVVDQKRGSYIRGTGKTIRRVPLPRGGSSNAILREQLKAKDDTIREIKAMFYDTNNRLRVLEDLVARGGSANLSNTNNSEGATSYGHPRS